MTGRRCLVFDGARLCLKDQPQRSAGQRGLALAELWLEAITVARWEGAYDEKQASITLDGKVKTQATTA